jgi:hypothetical protein
VLPDCEIAGQADTFIDSIHRVTADAEIYFLVNRNPRPEKINVTFRVSDRQPELWDPVTGAQRDLPQFEQKDGRTIVPLELELNGSMFVVFRKALKRGGSPPLAAQGTSDGDMSGTQRNFPTSKPIQELTGSWSVQFDPQWLYPTDGLPGEQAKGLRVFDKLEDWSKRPEPAIQHFSGTAVYRKTFELADSFKIQNLKSKIHLDLGTVKELARVRLNGQDLGVVWCAPWRVEISSAAKPGENLLEIEVSNLWPNRLIGDAKLPATQRRTQTNIPTNPEQALLSSGLLGPVRILMAE